MKSKSLATRRMWALFSLPLLLLMFVAGFTTAAAASSPVQLTFNVTTAPEAALGAPFGYYLRLTNTAATKQSSKAIVQLIAPDGTSYTLLTTTPTLAPGALSHLLKTVISSSYTSQTGDFTLKATLQVPSTGPVVSTVTYPITIKPTPTSNPNPDVYASVGGWQDSAAQGNPFYYNTVTSNLSSTSLSLRTQVSLVYPDNTQVLLSKGAKVTIAPGTSSLPAAATNVGILPTSVNTTEYTDQQGTFTLLAQVFDTSNNLVASNTRSIMRNANSVTAPTFSDIGPMGTNTSGINVDRMMMHMAGCGNYSDFMPGGTGAAFADIDGDGLDDLVFLDMMGMIFLYRNNGNNTFTDWSANSGITPMMMTDQMMAGPSGASFADIDNDGRPDLLILNGPDGMLQLFHNNGFDPSLGQVTFSEITETSGLAPMGAPPQNFSSTTWGDYDADGYLDLYVAVHADCMQMNQNDHLYHNNGDLTFTDRTDLLGGSTAKQVNGRGLAALFADYRQAGVVDLYVANDIGYSALSYSNVYWKNNGNGTFTDASLSTKLNLKQSVMGLAIGDYNNTGVFSIFNTNVATNFLMVPQLDGTYRNASGGYDAQVDRPTIPVSTGGTSASRTWSAGFYDFNNDGWQDLFASGDLVPGCPKCNIMDANLLMVSNGNGTFSDFTMMSGTAPMMSMTNAMPTAVFADFNNDGFVDILEAGMMGEPQVLVNSGVNMGTENWLEVKLVGQGCQIPTCGYLNKDAVGARVVAIVGDVKQLRTVVNGGNYQGNSSLTLHFGLGSATQIDTLTVYWPDAKNGSNPTVITAVPANQKITITEPQ